MIRYLFGRVLFGALILLTLSMFVFFLFFVAPGDPARMVAGDKATETQLIQIRTNLGLDRPIHEQYLSFLGKAVTGDLGFSYRNQQPVAKLIFNRLPATLSLVVGGVLVWLAVGIPIGIMSARHPGGVRDRLGQGFILIGLSFLGMGIVPPAPSWGGMLADAAGNSLYLVAGWLVLIPGLALLFTTLAFNILGDGLRDALDPRGRPVRRKAK
jgi:ABC-type dipeptide/oligopeptide/nickel transport system permease component